MSYKVTVQRLADDFKRQGRGGYFSPEALKLIIEYYADSNYDFDVVGICGNFTEIGYLEWLKESELAIDEMYLEPSNVLSDYGYVLAAGDFLEYFEAHDDDLSEVLERINEETGDDIFIKNSANGSWEVLHPKRDIVEYLYESEILDWFCKKYNTVYDFVKNYNGTISQEIQEAIQTEISRTGIFLGETLEGEILYAN